MQEKKFYMLKGIGEISFEVTDSYDNENEGNFIVGKDNTKTIKITNTTKLTGNQVHNLAEMQTPVNRWW